MDAACGKAGADLILLPETYISGYISEVHDDWPDERKSKSLSLAPQTVHGPVIEQLEKLTRELGLYIYCGLVERDGEQRYIMSVTVSPADGLMVRYRKVQVGQCEECVANKEYEHVFAKHTSIPWQ